ncbi:hypothetical protein [uncultured Pseudodesulfovibrio sp.]|uniref:hypothetical protein n=1 Tax=uncultured Pseudodesulfovibrio sp. TaxID=2035858 RepID=UPI0029C98E9E|nr:hypothetical protein [uncultured Pseudodesulfovibrio sp.]
MAKRGPIPKTDAELRKTQVNCRLTDRELQIVDARRGGLSRAAWLRTAALQRPPRIVPAVNREAWSYLAKLAGGLTFFVQEAKSGRILTMDESLLSELRRAVADVRRKLIGVEDEG